MLSGWMFKEFICVSAKQYWRQQQIRCQFLGRIAALARWYRCSSVVCHNCDTANKSSAVAEKADRCVCLLLADRRHPYIDMGRKYWGGLLCPFGWVELDGGLLLMFGEYLYHRRYGGDQHLLNVPSSLCRPVSSQVSSKYILNVTYLLSYF